MSGGRPLYQTTFCLARLALFTTQTAYALQKILWDHLGHIETLAKLARGIGLAYTLVNSNSSLTPYSNASYLKTVQYPFSFTKGI